MIRALRCIHNNAYCAIHCCQAQYCEDIAHIITQWTLTIRATMAYAGSNTQEAADAAIEMTVCPELHRQ
jgi:hypothetical protein